MLTVKLYKAGKIRIHEAGGVSILGDDRHYELTLHDVPGKDDFRVDLTYDEPPPDCPVSYWDSAIIENANGKTSQTLYAVPYLQAQAA